jgi:predicted transposase/invertase (TIGR01784 family)
VDVTFLPTEQLGDWKEERRAVYDLYCITNAGEYVIVEMQLRHQTYFAERALFYASHAIRSQAIKGQKWDFNLKAVYMVAILNSVMFDEPEVANCVREEVWLYRKNMDKKLTDKLSFVFIELPKFHKTRKELETNTDGWLFALKNLDRLKNRPHELSGKIFERLFELAKIKRLNKEEMATYTTSMKEYMDFYGYTSSIEADAERKFGAKMAEKDRKIEEKDRENAALKSLLQQYNIPLSALSKNN